MRNVKQDRALDNAAFGDLMRNSDHPLSKWISRADAKRQCEYHQYHVQSFKLRSSSTLHILKMLSVIINFDRLRHQ